MGYISVRIISEIFFVFLQAMMEHCHYLEEQLDAYKGTN